KCTILPLIKFDVNDIEPDLEITRAYQKLREETALGSQYEWIPRFAKMVPGLEIGLEKAESSIAYNCIMKFGNVKKVTDGNTSYCTIEQKESSEELIKVFGLLRFPLPLFEKTKLEVKSEYERLGFEKSINKTWFCHYPINNEPCGICNPCRSVVDEGMA